MRIGLNLLHIHEGIGGVWNYVENLIAALGVQDKENRYFIFVTHKSQNLVPDQKNFKKILVNIDPLKTLQRVLFENTVLHYYGWKYKIDCFHWFANVLSPFLLVPGLVTIHDLLFLNKPGSYSLVKSLYLKIMLKITAKKAESILAISKTTAFDIKKKLKPRTDKLYVVPVILNKVFVPPQEIEVKKFKSNYRLPENYWLYVANFYPHKNHICLIRAYAKFKKQNMNPWPLVLRGESGSDTGNTKQLIEAEIKSLNLDKDVIWLQRLSYQHLPLLYSGAGALIFPSLFEGGGIPVIEAMASGCPVAASNIDVVKEFADNAALFFNGKSTDSICDAMKKLQKNPDFREELIQKGIKRAKFFTQKHVIEKLLNAYKNI